MGLGLLNPEISLMNFYPPCMDVGRSPFLVSAPSTSLDGCGFFNFVVVRLSFNSISDGSE